MRRAAVTVALLALFLPLAACGIDTEKSNRVGSHIRPIVNAIPGPGESLGTYCTAYNPDPELHNHTIAELVAAHTPFILLFGTPSHCTQCQNQIDTVRGYRKQYHNAFEVIHIDQYKNSEVYTALRVKGDPWTFLIDANGVIEAIYPGVTTWDNLDGAIKKMLAVQRTPDAPSAPPGASPVPPPAKAALSTAAAPAPAKAHS
ncbi:MAG: hypothetical protein OEW11_03020 [Nitrospirota bacterium]|nr:hypothetical protein [Nitrospirota bacterium]